MKEEVERIKKLVGIDHNRWEQPCTCDKCKNMCKEDCAKIIDNEVKSIGMWMWGDVKGYVLEKKVAFTKKYKDESREDEDCEEWEEVDSCWGCYEETDELIKEVMIENGLEE